jgi:glycosyltransferase involved in cell wall biosynthesis
MHILISKRDCLGGTAGIGIDRFCFELANGFLEIGCDVTLLTHHIENEEVLEKWNATKFEIVTVNDSNNSIPRIIYDWWKKGSKIIDRLGADAIILNGFVPVNVRIPRICVLHDKFTMSDLPLHVRKTLYTFSNLYMDYCVTVSSEMKNEAEYQGIKVHEIIPTCIDLNKFKYIPFEKRENFILHIGTAEGKRVDISIETVKKLVKKGLNVKLFIIGSRNRYVEGLNEEWINYLGFVSDEDLLDLLSKAKALILPTVKEAVPYVVREAQASGTPVVVSSGVPVESIVNGDTGFIINSWNPEDYAKSLELILKNEEVWRNMSVKGREFSKNFDRKRIAFRYLELISTLLESSINAPHH